MALYTEYIPTDKEGQFIKFTINFNKDTYHWATSQPKQKGYQLVATPVQRTELENNLISEQFTAFSGFYEIIYPVERQSSKRLQEAITKLSENKERYLQFFINKGINIKNDKHTDTTN